jgi:hypothetical protein
VPGLVFVVAVLGPGHPCGDAAVLPASELFGNSASGLPGETVAIAVIAGDGLVRVEVTDRSALSVPELCPAGGQADGGRGKVLVEGLAAGWGWWRDGQRTVTWFELRHG